MSTITDAEIIEGTVDEQSSQALVPAPALSVTPTVKASELVDRLGVIRESMLTAMTEGVDYGKVPGTDKDTLLKPGAEKLSVLFQLDVQLLNEKKWGPGDHLTVTSHATVFHAPTGHRLGCGEGVCTTREKKYATRRGERVCPACGKPAIIKGKVEYGGGWLCFKKKDGCGAKYADGASEIESQQVGDIENPDLPDLWNTVVKMAEKRARVDAVLSVTGASALFTQDLDEAIEPAATVPPYGPAYDPSMEGITKTAVMCLAGGDKAMAKVLWDGLLKDLDGYMPAGAAIALIRAAEAQPNAVPTVEVPEVA